MLPGFLRSRRPAFVRKYCTTARPEMEYKIQSVFNNYRQFDIDHYAFRLFDYIGRLLR